MTDPRTTCAILVGIEKYAIGQRDSRWNVRGPAAAARAFASWLRSRNVPADRIELLLTALDEKDMLAVDGVAPKPCSRDAMEAAFLKNLPNMAGCDTLIMFWCGHGTMDYGREHWLFCPEFDEPTMHAVRLENLLDMLRRRFAWLQRQVVVVEACANWVEKTGLKFDSLPLSFPTKDEPEQEVFQDQLFAASAGERAYIEVDGIPYFSDAVLKEFKAPGRPWPPESEAALPVITRYLGELNIAGGQTPRAVTWGRAGKNTRFSDHRAADSFRFRPFRHLWGELLQEIAAAIAQCRGRAGSLTDDIGLLQRQIGGSVPPGADALTILDAAFRVPNSLNLLTAWIEGSSPDGLERRRLLDLIEQHIWTLEIRAAVQESGIEFKTIRDFARRRLAQAGKALPNGGIDTFLSALHNSAAADALAPPLLLFAADLLRTKDIPSLRTWLKGVRPEVLEAPEPADLTALSLVHLIIDIAGRETFAFRGWLVDASGAPVTVDADLGFETSRTAETLAQLEDAIRRMVQSVEDNVDFDHLFIELIADLELFQTAFDEWKAGAGVLGKRYPVVLRWRERLIHWNKPIGKRWQRLADAARRQTIHNGWVPLVWLEKSGGDFDARLNSVREGKEGGCVAFDVTPSMEIAAPAGPSFEPLLRDLLGSCGAPFLVWLRRDPADWKKVEEDLRKALAQHTLEGVSAIDLSPVYLRDLRAAGTAAPIVVMWDDPRRNPFAGNLVQPS